jgi:hypothetical protein
LFSFDMQSIAPFRVFLFIDEKKAGQSAAQQYPINCCFSPTHRHI